MNCTCGHAEEEHGDDPKYPGSTKCQIEDCDCIAYEAEYDDEDDIDDFEEEEDEEEE